MEPEPYVYLLDVVKAWHGYRSDHIPADRPVHLRLKGRDPGTRYQLEGVLEKADGEARGVGPWTFAPDEDEKVVVGRIHMGGPFGVGDTLVLKVSKLDGSAEPVRPPWRILLVPDPPGPAWRWANQTEWVLSEVAREIVELLYAAGKGSAPDDDLLVDVHRTASDSTAPVDVQVRHGSERFSARLGDDPVWRPASYAALAAEAIGAWGSPDAPDGTERPGHAVEALTHPTATTIESENQRVSAWLTRELGSASAHEEGALVLSALALREHSRLYDVRAILSRVTAHLAVARALREGNAGIAGELAEAALLSLAGRQTESLARLDRMADVRPRGSAAERAWRRALRIRTTRDWRLLKGEQRATLLERLEHLYALASSRGDAWAIDYLEGAELERIPDWGRIVLRFRPSVRGGNLFAQTAVEAELLDATKVLFPGGGDLHPEALRRALDVPMGRCIARAASGPPKTRVIDRGLWAAYFQRHLVSAASATERHLRASLGLPEHAREHRAAFEEAFGPLALGGWMAAQAAPEDGSPHPWEGWDPRSTCQAAARLSQSEPERLALGYWHALTRLCPGERRSGELRSYLPWFQTLSLPGTAYQVVSLRFRPLFGMMTDDDFFELHRIAPWDEHVAQYYFVKKYGRRNADGLEEAFGPLLKLRHWVMRFAVEVYEDDPAMYVEAARGLCFADGDTCPKLARYLVDHARDEEAMEVYERAYSHARDRVGVANEMGWLVGHHAETGRLPRALEIARHGARVHSETGLETYGRLLERLGRDEEALEVFRDLAKRYENGRSSLDEYLVAYGHRVGDGRHGDEVAAALEKMFPGGLERVTGADFEGVPTDGVRILTDTTRLKEIGLDRGAVIVALDGYRVHSYRQYSCVRRFTYGRPISLIVYHKARYAEIEASLPQRSFNSLLADYPPPRGRGM